MKIIRICRIIRDFACGCRDGNIHLINHGVSVMIKFNALKFIIYWQDKK